MNYLDRENAAAALQNGGVVIFPTDTVWGIGVLISRSDAIEKLYKIKKRTIHQPTAVLVGSLEQARHLAHFDARGEDLAKRYWPGGLTLILPLKTNIPQIVQGEKGTVGLRIPDHPITQEILNRVGEGIVTSSANFAGEPAPQSRGELSSDLLKKVDYIVGEGECGGLAPSSIVDLTHPTPHIVRHGSIDITNWLQQNS